MIDPSSIVVVTLEGVTVNEADFGILIDSNTTTALTTEPILILCIHNSLAEITLIDVEIRGVQRYQPRQEDVLDLLTLQVCLCRLRRQVITKHEASLLGCMRMKVNVDVQVSHHISIVHDGFFDSPNSRVVKL